MVHVILSGRLCNRFGVAQSNSSVIKVVTLSAGSYSQSSLPWIMRTTLSSIVFQVEMRLQIRHEIILQPKPCRGTLIGRPNRKRTISKETNGRKNTIQMGERRAVNSITNAEAKQEKPRWVRRNSKRSGTEGKIRNDPILTHPWRRN